MLLVPIDRLGDGDVTATAVGHPQRPGSCLLQRNVKLTDSLIGRMRDMGLQYTWVQRDGFEDLDAQIGVHIPQRRMELYNTVAEAFGVLAKRPICKEDFDGYCAKIVPLIGDLYESGGDTGIPSERLFNNGDELNLHTAQVTYLSVAIGRRVQEYILAQRGQGAASGAAELAALGAAAMLHDVAKIGWDKELTLRHGTGECGEDRYLSHPVDGFRLLSGKVNALAGAVCLQHHQKWDGTGWPDMTRITRGRIAGGLVGENIHIYARIVAMANAFDALTMEAFADTGRMLPGIYALSVMQSDDYAGHFDPVLLYAFLRFAHAFPVGVEVVLSDGTAAGVVGQSDDPCRPVVRLADGTTVNLATNFELSIRSSQGYDVGKWLFPKPSNPIDAPAGVNG